MLIDGEPRLHEVEVVIARQGPMGTLDLLVLDGMGDPRSRASISLTNDAGSPVSGFHGKMVDLDVAGRARLDVPPGHYQLEIADSAGIASIEGYALASTREIEVIAGNSLPLEAVVHTGGRIRLTVRDPDGDITAVRRARLLDADGKQLQAWFIRVLDGGWTTDLDEPGPALLGNPVPPGRYRLRLTRENEQALEREVDVTAARTTEVEIRLPR